MPTMTHTIDEAPKTLAGRRDSSDRMRTAANDLDALSDAWRASDPAFAAELRRIAQMIWIRRL